MTEWMLHSVNLTYNPVSLQPSCWKGVIVVVRHGYAFDTISRRFKYQPEEETYLLQQGRTFVIAVCCQHSFFFSYRGF